MFRYYYALVCVLVGVLAAFAFYSVITSFSIQYNVAQSPSDVFAFVKNPYSLLDTCYSIKAVNVTGCDVERDHSAEHCQISVVQDFVHVGQQTVYISTDSYAENLTIHNQMIMFHGVIAADCTYTFKSIEDATNRNSSGTIITEWCRIAAPRLLHRYANRTVYETHIAMLSNIETSMLISTSRSEVLERDVERDT